MIIKGQLKELIRDSIEETLNELMDVHSAQYGRNETHQGAIATGNLSTTARDVTLHLPI